MTNFLRENAEQIKQIVVKTKGTPTQKLLAILMQAGIDKTADLAEMTGLTERAVQTAKRNLLRETDCVTQPISAQPIAETQPIALLAQPIAVAHVHARVEDNNLLTFLEPTVVSEVKCSEEKKGRAVLTADRGPSHAEAHTAFEAYNRTALVCGIPQARSLTPGRTKSLIARLREHGMEGWVEALANVSTSSFLKGKNDRNWRVSFDFLLRADALPRVIEGAYADAAQGQGFNAQPVKKSALAIIAEMEANGAF